MKNNEPPLNEPSGQALFRYQVLSQVLIREQTGEPRPQAIRAVAASQHATTDGQVRKVSKRSLYRWLAAFEAQGFAGLLPAERKHTQGSMVVAQPLLDFFETQKTADPRASVPELIRRARGLGMVSPDDAINRVTVWRSLKRMGIDTQRCKAPKNRDCRRFAYPHRMDMVLCDGKHFRAGPGRLRRVAFFFLDDATRMGLHVVVGTSETAQLFLRGLYDTIQSYGLMSALYVDNGSGFIANDSIEVLRKLGILFIHGSKGYPEGHGKIERFNRTASEQVIRFLDANPEIDPSCSAIELRLSHYLSQQYNHTPHESLGGHTPWFPFHNDKRPLRFQKSEDQFRQAFVLDHKRRVSADNVISFKSVAYEVPRGHADTRVMLHRNLLDESISIIHQGRLVRLASVDLHANARNKRARRDLHDKEEVSHALPKSSAQIAFDRDLRPIVDPDGGFCCPDQRDQEEDNS